MDNGSEIPNDLPCTDWQLCAICQEHIDEPLQCPADSKRSNLGAGYSTLAANIQNFATLKCMPKKISLSRLDEGNGIEDTFFTRKARWHKSCYALFNSTKLKRAKKRHAQQHIEEAGGKFTRSNTSTYTQDTCPTCFFCDKADSRPLHKVSTLGLDARVRESAALLNDEKLLAKLSSGDLIAIEAAYHVQCLSLLYRNAAYAQKGDENDYEMLHRLDGIALAELISYIEESRFTGAELPSFKLADLGKMYKNCLQHLGKDTPARVNTSRLKERLLFHVPELHSYNKGRDVFLAFSEDVGAALHKANKENVDDEAIHLVKTAAIIRKDILASKYSFSGSFESNCQENSVPASLLSLVNMILNGPNIETQAYSSTNRQAALTISQLLQYNTYIRRRDGEIKRERRNKSRETPLPIYVGMTVHAKTRSRDLVETLHDLGMSISYDRVLAISTDIGNEVCRRYNNEGAVCPSNLRLHLFTTAAVDNIDHNPSSTTARDSFHGTGISLFQHPTTEHPGTARATIDISNAAADTKSVNQLPNAYTEVPPVLEISKTPKVPAMSVAITSDEISFCHSLEEEMSWLKHSSHSMSQESLQEDELISWGAFHSSDTNLQSRASATSALLPLFPDEAKSVAMIRHAMNIIKLSVNHLNPGQVPVLALDQPLYAVAKEIQWNWSDTHGEKNFVIMFGGLHIELAFLKVLGDWLEGSGWTTLLADANVATSGTAESFLKAANIARTRRAHQVTACCLFILLQKAHTRYKESIDDHDDALDFDQWCIQQSPLLPQFQYWYTALQLELLLLVFVKSLRRANFNLYINVLYKMLPWFFAMNHPNYARWLPVHLRDMCALEQTAPDVAAAFKNGLFTVNKTTRKFSAIAIDQAHEQNNAMVKGDGGAVGLTENPGALRRWMLSGPEIARLVNEFQAGMTPETHNPTSILHHEAQRSYQASFCKDVKALVTTAEDLGNPFLEETQDLFVLDTKVVAEESAVSRMQQIESIGRKQCKAFISERLVEQKKPLEEPIKRNNLGFFTTSTQKKMSRAAKQLSSIKKDCSLFSRLYISCQTRDGDLDEFFKYENQGYPPSLSDQGNLRLPSKKSELTECLEALTKPESDRPKDVEVTIIDGAAVVNMIKPTKTQQTFSDYAFGSFIPYIKAQLSHVIRIDVVWDEYIENSLKATTRGKRGSGVRQRVEGDNKLPRNWKEFLRVDKNKQELFKFLAVCLSSMDIQKQVISTYGEQIKSTLPCFNAQNIAPCTHEEADTRMLLHAADAVQCGHKKILLRTVDTDVLVLAVAAMQKLKELCGDQNIELWVGFGTGKNHRYIPAHGISNSLSPEAALGLPAFHALTGCDTVSCFLGKGKKTAMETWNKFNDVTDVFLALTNSPSEISPQMMETLERFVVLLYDRTSTKTAVNDARKQLFIQKGRLFDNIPPTRAALSEHIKRAAYQAGHIWGQALIPCPAVPSPQDWGWTFDDGLWRPLWTTLPEVMRSCQELICCGCQKGCRGRCSCTKNELRCTDLCRCPAECDKR